MPIAPPRAVRIKTSEGWVDLAIQGPSGPVGPTGATGPPGATGATGATGPAGPTGTPGTVTPGSTGALFYTGAGGATAWTDPLRLQIDANGKHSWGDGVAVDTVLYRSAAGVLKTDTGLAAGGNVTVLGAAADANAQISLTRNYAGAGLPGITLGPGGATVPDTFLYRNAANELRTPGTLRIGATNVLSANGMYGGANMDFRSTGDIYVTTDTAATSVNLRDLIGNTARWLNGVLNLQGAGGFGKLQFQSDTVANLYRTAAGVLKTDAGLNIVGDLILSSAGAHLQAANTTAAAVGGSNIAKLPIYNASNALIGYIPIYQT